MNKQGYVYLLANNNRDLTYTGVTSDLLHRIAEHKAGINCIYTTKYQLKDLMYFEHFDLIEDAIAREKKLKKYKREWKWNLIDSLNPKRIDLFDSLIDQTYNSEKDS